MAACGANTKEEPKEEPKAEAEEKKDDFQASVNLDVDAGYTRPTRQSVSQIVEKDEKDESLKKMKKQLLGPNFERVWDKDFKGNFIFGTYNLVPINADGTPNEKIKPIVIDKTGFVKSGKSNKAPLFRVEEGLEFKKKLVFKTQRELVNGLRIKSHTKKQGMLWKAIPAVTSLDKCGSYTCGEEITWMTPDTVEEKMPSGKLARGTYKQTVTIMDDFHDASKKYPDVLAEISFIFDIAEKGTIYK